VAGKPQKGRELRGSKPISPSSDTLKSGPGLIRSGLSQGYERRALETAPLTGKERALKGT